MAFCIVDGTTVPVAPNAGKLRTIEVGDKHRAFDGTMRSSLTDHMREWRVKSAPMASTDADTLYASLTSLSQPKTCSGDLLGASISCYGKFEGRTEVAHSTTPMAVMEFTLQEAS